jgi:hypothetical protein
MPVRLASCGEVLWQECQVCRVGVAEIVLAGTWPRMVSAERMNPRCREVRAKDNRSQSEGVLQFLRDGVAYRHRLTAWPAAHIHRMWLQAGGPPRDHRDQGSVANKAERFRADEHRECLLVSAVGNHQLVPARARNWEWQMRSGWADHVQGPDLSNARDRYLDRAVTHLDTCDERVWSSRVFLDCGEGQEWNRRAGGRLGMAVEDPDPDSALEGR